MMELLYFTFITSPNIVRVFQTQMYKVFYRFDILCLGKSKVTFWGKIFDKSIHGTRKVYAQDSTSS